MTGELTEMLRVGQFWFLEALFATLVIATALAGSRLVRMLDTSGKLTLAGVVCLAAALVLIAPRTNRILPLPSPSTTPFADTASKMAVISNAPFESVSNHPVSAIS